MSFNFNDLMCSPMYNSTNKQIIGYMCSPPKTREHFENLIDNTNSTNRNQVKNKDDEGNPWHYSGGVTVSSSNQDQNTSYLVLNLVDNNGSNIQTGLEKLKTGFGVSDSLPFIFHFHNSSNGKSFVFRRPAVAINNNELILAGSRTNSIVDADFNELKTQQGTMQLRIGVYDINNGSQRQNVNQQWDRQ